MDILSLIVNPINKKPSPMHPSKVPHNSHHAQSFKQLSKIP